MAGTGPKKGPPAADQDFRDPCSFFEIEDYTLGNRAQMLIAPAEDPPFGHGQLMQASHASMPRVGSPKLLAPEFRLVFDNRRVHLRSRGGAAENLGGTLCSPLEMPEPTLEQEPASR